MSRNAIACGFLIDGKTTARYRVAADSLVSPARIRSTRERLQINNVFYTKLQSINTSANSGTVVFGTADGSKRQ
jgi:hypothetical protein